MEALHLRIRELERAETELAQAKRELEASEERYARLVDSVPDVIVRTDLEGNILFINDYALQISGYSREEFLGENILRFVPPEDHERLLNNVALMVGGRLGPKEYNLIMKDGRTIPFEVNGDVLRDKDGKPFGLVNVCRDISRRRQEEQARRLAEAKYLSIFENAIEGIYQSTPEGRFVTANPAMAEIYGYESARDLIESITDIETQLFVDPADRKELLRRMAEEGLASGYEVRHRRKGGEVIWVTLHTRAIRDEAGRTALLEGMVIDITERKRAEEALRNSEENFRKMTEASNVGIAIIDGERFIYVNPMTRQMSGFSEEEYLSRPLLDFVTPESKELIRRRAMDRLEGKPVPDRYEFTVLTRDGGIRWAEAGAAVIEYNGKPATIFTIYDVTDRKAAEAEREALQARLNSAQKMEALGRLAGGVAHDLNNVLGALSGYSELLLLEIPEGRKARGHAERILQSTEKAAAIIQDLLTLARRGVSSSDVMNLNDLVSGFLKTAVFEKIRELHPRVTFRTECQEGLLNIRGSLVHLEKTLMNLVSNAAESIADGGEVSIRTENRYLDKPIGGYDEIREGDYAILTVSDTGTGIPAEDMARIFEPFYTRKTMGRSGTGLGLAIVWGTVKDQNGYIDVQTKIGEGTVFTLYFPVTREEPATPQQEVPLERYRGSGESVLVVDDIAEQREVASGLLKRIGYEVHAVSSGEEAVAYLRRNKADILVLDMIMEPGIDGLETYRRILELHPGQKAILVSGFSETDQVRAAQRLGAGAYVRKPYVMEKIGVALRAELGRPSA